MNTIKKILLGVCFIAAPLFRTDAVSISVEFGTLASVGADVIVDPCNKQNIMGGGVTGALQTNAFNNLKAQHPDL